LILRFFRRSPSRAVAERLYDQVAAASRQPGLYAGGGIPDTVEGRFESVSLHAILLLRRLRALPAPAAEVAQDFVDAVFRRFDMYLRELGVGDMGVGKRMKKLAQSFYGRAQTYNDALDAGDAAALAAALARNALGREEPADALAAYVIACDRALASQNLDAILRDGPAYPTPTETSHGR